MKMEVVATVLDEAMAEMFAEAMGERDIPVEIVPLGTNTYFGSVTQTSFQLRVPADRLADARGAIAMIEAELGRNPAEAEAERSTDDEAPADTGPRPRRIWMAIVLGLALPVPVSVLYARFVRLGWLLLGLGLAASVAAFATRSLVPVVVACGLKGLDVALAPLCVVLTNRRRGAAGSLTTGAVASLVLLALVGLGTWRLAQLVEEARVERESSLLFHRTLTMLRDGDPAAAAAPEPRFPDIPLGRMHALIVQHKRESMQRGSKIFEVYQKEYDAWGTRRGPVTAPWIAERRTGATSLRWEVTMQERSLSRLLRDLETFSTYDEATLALYQEFSDAQYQTLARADEKLLLHMKDLTAAWEARAALLEGAAGKPDLDETTRAEDERHAARAAELTDLIGQMLFRR